MNSEDELTEELIEGYRKAEKKLGTGAEEFYKPYAAPPGEERSGKTGYRAKTVVMNMRPKMAARTLAGLQR